MCRSYECLNLKPTLCSRSPEGLPCLSRPHALAPPQVLLGGYLPLRILALPSQLDSILPVNTPNPKPETASHLQLPCRSNAEPLQPLPTTTPVPSGVPGLSGAASKRATLGMKGRECRHMRRMRMERGTQGRGDEERERDLATSR